MERCVDTFEDYMHEAQREWPDHLKGRHHCLNTLMKPLGYLSSGAKVMDSRLSLVAYSSRDHQSWTPAATVTIHRL